MRLVIDCDESLLSEALDVLNVEIAPSYAPWRERYNKVGWGWTHHLSGPHRCFVRRIKDGLSLRQIRTGEPDVGSEQLRKA